MNLRCNTRSLVFVGFSILVGCATSVEVPPETQAGLVDLRDQLESGKAQIQRTTNSARDLTQRPQAQIVPQIERLARDIQTLREMAAKGRESFEQRQGQSLQYFTHWESQLKGMSDSVREAGEERHSKSIASFKTLQDDVTSLRETFRPYMAALSEAELYLRTDTTAAGVKTITPRIEEALSVENSLMKKMDVVSAQIDSMRGSK